MTKTVTVLAMHAEMLSLFPATPETWTLIDTSQGVEKAIAEHGDQVEILLSASIEKLDKQALDQFPKLKMIASISAGFSNVDLEECRRRGIEVTNSPGLNAADVADIAASMMTSLLLKFPKHQDFILSDQWVTPSGPLRHSLKMAVVGIVGLGSIGQEVVKRLQPFGVDLRWWGPRDKPEVSLPYVSCINELAQQCQGLVICCRPDDSTHHLINQEILDLLGSEGIVVNVARGSVVDEVALIESLKSNAIAGAGLDVFDPEPTGSERWQGVPNVILTPHQGGTTYETLFAQAELTQQNIQQFVAGEPVLTSVL
ncbi:MAG: NAD(P)-dependent oxidoreductase [Cellvibrionaceae bacterium]